MKKILCILLGITSWAVLMITANAQSRLSTEVVDMVKSPPGASREADRAPSTERDEAHEIARLEALPAVQVPIQDATLASAVQIVAQSAGMNFIAPAAEDFTDTVSLSTTINPWRLLQLLSDRYRFAMRFQTGVWVFSRESAGALIAKTYVLKHTNLDTIESSGGSSLSLESSSGDAGRNSGQGFSLVYKIQSKQIVDDIRQLIGLPPLASQTLVAKDGRMPDDDGRRSVAPAGGGRPDSAQRVLYLADCNSIYVVAFRSQHDHVAEYLRQLDQSPVQIRIEARFFATSNDPQKIIGVDPTGLQPSIKLDNLTTQVDLNRLGATRWPAQGVLSSSALALQINALEHDSKTEQIQNPFVVTTNNREALFSVGMEQPFLDSSTLSPGAVDGGLGSTTNRISVKRIGTSVNVVPTWFRGEAGEKPRIRLVVKLEIGRLTGFQQVTPQVRYPIVDSQKYEYTVYVNEGQALAFGGLTGLSTSLTEERVPVLGKIPFLGRAFRSTNQQDQQRRLIGYIIPTLVPDSPADAPPPVKLSDSLSRREKRTLSVANVETPGGDRSIGSQ